MPAERSEPLAGSILHLLGYTSMEAKSGPGFDVGRRLGASRRAGGRGQGRSEAESVASLEAFRRSLQQWKEKSQRQASSDVVLRPLVQCLCANQIARRHWGKS